MARALVRPITRRQALSYDRTSPNGRGVTALVEMNGRGAYARRYRRAKQSLRKAAQRAHARTGGVMRKKRGRRRLTGAATRRHRRNPGRSSVGGGSKAYSRGYSRIFGGKKRKHKHSGAGGHVRSKRRKGIGSVRTTGGRSALIAQLKRKHPRASAAQIQNWARFKARAMGARLTHAAWAGSGPKHKIRRRRGTNIFAKAAPKRRRKTQKKRRPLTRLYAGKYRTVVGRIGTKRRRTYAYRTKKGHIGHVPIFAQLGFSSSLAMRRALAKSPKRAAAADKRRAKIMQRRSVLAERAAKRILAGRDPYAPNRPRRRRRTVTLKEWQMNKPRRRRRTRRRHLTSNPRRRVTRRRRKSAHRRRPAARRRRYTSNKRRARRTLTVAAARKRGRRLRRRAATSVRRVARRIGRMKFSSNRRRHHRRHGGFRRNYRRNLGGAFVQTLKDTLKFGAVGFVGYGAHRVLTNLVDEQLLSRLGFMNSETIAPYRKLIAGFITAIGGGLATAKWAPPKYATSIGGGVAVSFIQQLALMLLGKLGDTGAKASAYLSAYPDDAGYAYRGYGSYYTFNPQGQIYPSRLRAGVGGYGGYGEYLETAPVGVTQASAGFGAMPLLQAAAGVGEYEVVPGFGSDGLMDEGISPNLHSAEQALNVAEAAAGMGDLSLVSTVDPMMQAVAVPDEPGGSRSGVLAGRDGVFG